MKHRLTNKSLAIIVALLVCALTFDLSAAETNSSAAKSSNANTGFAPVGFDLLASYNFEVPDGPTTNKTETADVQIPAKVKALDKKKVSITGFMLPLKVDNGTVTEFLLMKDQSMCCYGATPKITEWVSVKTGAKGFKSVMDQAITVDGTLHVGAMRENGYLIGIYAMDAEKMIAPN
jgi:hypothetical protein